mgnify:CR=1 FL=1
MDDFKKLTEQLLKIYINAESVNDLGLENYFDENISLIGTGKHELFTNLHEFLESFKFDVKRRGKIRIEVQNLHQEEERLDDDHVLAHGTVDFTGLFKDGSICFKMETRFTIIYKWTNGKWLVQHLHQSTPDLEQMDGEEFPVTLGKQVKKNRQAVHALGTAYYHISRLDLKTKRVELVKRSRKMNIDIKDNILSISYEENNDNICGLSVLSALSLGLCVDYIYCYSKYKNKEDEKNILLQTMTNDIYFTNTLLISLLNYFNTNSLLK